MRFVWKQAQAKCLPRHDTAPRRPETPAEIRESPMRSRPPPSEKETARAAKAHPMEDISLPEALSRSLPPHSLPPRTAITLRGAARATAVRVTAVVTAADATAGVRRRFQGARVRSSKNRGGLIFSDCPDFFLRVRDYFETGVLRRRGSHAGCAGSSALSASSSEIPSASATPLP